MVKEGRETVPMDSPPAGLISRAGARKGRPRMKIAG